MKVYNPNPQIDFSDCVLWQYNNAPNIKAIIGSEQLFYNDNVYSFWTSWISDIFNINTAKTFGLNSWGAFLGVARPSYNKDGVETVFDDEQYRLLLMARLMIMNGNGSIHDINRYLNYLFPNRPVFVVDRYNMSIDIIFYYEPTPDEVAVITSPDFLPRPAGVLASYLFIPADKILGFTGSQLGTFDNGVFFT